MDNSKSRGCCGIFPANAMLANPYVPCQPEGQEQYTAKAGLIRGTLFPCLDLPFLGMVNTEEKTDTMIHQLQALGFAVQELGEYLDTHGEDAEATELFRQYAELYENAIARHAEECGPMFQKQAVRDGKYTWNETPWPWEYRANGEG